MVRKIRRELNTPGTNSKNLRQSINKLEETPCVFFVTIVFKAWNNTPSFVFCYFTIGLMLADALQKPI